MPCRVVHGGGQGQQEVPGCWLILDAQGGKLTEAMENLEGLCTYWGWELDLTALT